MSLKHNQTIWLLGACRLITSALNSRSAPRTIRDSYVCFRSFSLFLCGLQKEGSYENRDIEKRVKAVGISIISDLCSLLLSFIKVTLAGVYTNIEIVLVTFLFIIHIFTFLM